MDVLLDSLTLAWLTLIIGELSISLAFLAVRRRIDQTTDPAVQYQNLSVDALKGRDKPAYTTANKLTNDAFMKSFFSRLPCPPPFCSPFSSPWLGCSTAFWGWNFFCRSSVSP